MNLEKARVLILVNLDSNNKKAEKKWRAIARGVREQLPPETNIIEYHIPFDIRQCLHDQVIGERVNCVISAGGDGTGNMILNELLHIQKEHGLTLAMGFIGLGSSNDLLKPCDTMIGGVMVKINLDKTLKADAGLAVFTNSEGKAQKRYFLANSSIGVGASANWLFNRQDVIIRFFKSRWMGLTILYTTIKAILGFRNYPVEIRYQDNTHKLMLSHLSVLKNPHVSGDLKFDQKIAPDDGRLGLNICENMSKPELIGVMMDLKKGEFSGKPKRHTAYITEAQITSADIIPIELDGEIALTKEVCYFISPGAITVLQ